MSVEFVEVEFEDKRDLRLEASDCASVDPNDPRLTEEITQIDPEANAYGPNFAILKVRMESSRGSPLTIAEQR